MKSSKNQLTRIVCKKYIAYLHNSYTGHNDITVQEIIEYLYENYGDLDKSNLEKVEQRMTSPFDPT